MEDSGSMWRSVHIIRQIARDLDKEDRVVIAWARLAIKIKAGRDTGEIASKLLQSIEGSLLESRQDSVKQQPQDSPMRAWNDNGLQEQV